MLLFLLAPLGRKEIMLVDGLNKVNGPSIMSHLTTQNPSGTSRLDSASVILLAALTLVLVSAEYHRALNPASAITGIDFRLYYDAATKLVNKESLYNRTDPTASTLGYSPLVPILLRPITYLPYDAALKLWYFLSVSSAILGIAIFARVVPSRGFEPIAGAMMLVLCLHFWPTTMNFALGQINFLLLLLLCAMYAAVARDNFWIVVVLILIGSLVKTWFLGFGLFFLLERRWRSFIAIAVGFAGAMVSLFAIAGWEQFAPFVRIHIAFGSQSYGQCHPYSSILGVARSHLAANLMVIPFSTSRLLYYAFVGSCFILLLSGLVFSGSTRRGKESADSQIRLGATTIAVLLMLPMCAQEYFILCLPCIWWFLLNSRGSDRLAAGVPFWIALLSYITLSRPWPVFPPIPPQFREGIGAVVVSIPFFALVGLFTAFVIVAYRRRHEIQKS